MDSQSISVGILAIMSSASFVAETIRKLDDAPDDLAKIADAAQALETCLEDVRSCCTTKHMLNEGIFFYLQCSEQKLLELTMYLEVNELTNPGKLCSPDYDLRYQDTLKLYKQQLSEIRSDLNLALAVFKYGQTGRIEVDLQQLVCLGEATLQSLHQQACQIGGLAMNTEGMRLAQGNMARILEVARAEGSKTHAALKNTQASSIVRLHHSIEMEKPVDFLDHKGAAKLTLASHKGRQPSADCSGACRCMCHKKRGLTTPSAATDQLGDLAVTFSGIGPLTSACNISSCARNVSPSASVDFSLPSQLAANMISIWLKAAPIQGPGLLLRSRRIIETPAYYTAEQGNLPALKKMYTEGRAGIHDVNPVSGRNTLFDSIFRGHLHIVRFLLDSGADMEAADFCGFTPRDLAFQRVHTACPADLAEQLKLLFRLDEMPEGYEFTIVHRIVLGLSKLDLADYLKQHPQEIDKTDLLGRTPLWWAVRRDDKLASVILLDNGADPNIANAAGRSPLHNAAAQGNRGLVGILLTYKADVHQKAFDGKTPLHGVGVYGEQKGVDVVMRLLKAGANINEQDRYGRTTISLCCFNTHVNIARCLLEQGADTTIPDAKGWLPWHWAIYDSAAEIVGLYLDHKCDLSVVIDGGTTILHFVAEYCAAEEVVDTLLAKANLSSVDPAAKNMVGKTAAEILEERHSVDTPPRPLGESLYVKIGRLIAVAGAAMDVGSSVDTTTN